jgi:hypothetical protein
LLIMFEKQTAVNRIEVIAAYQAAQEAQLPS